MKVISGTVLALGAFLLGSAGVVGALMVSADRLAETGRGTDASGNRAKIGTALEHLRPPPPAPSPRAAAPEVTASRSAPAAQPVSAPLAAAAEPVGLRPAPAAVPGQPSAAEPAATVQTATGAPAIIEEPAPASPSLAAGERYPKGSRGCTTYRSYDPRTQTYRSFDGTVKPCRPEG